MADLASAACVSGSTFPTAPTAKFRPESTLGMRSVRNANGSTESGSCNRQPSAKSGCDYATDIDREAQRTWLARQRDLAAELGLPLIVHCVRAYDDLKAMLSGFPLPVIVHGFTGSEQLASQLLDRGWYLSFGKTVERSPKTRRTLRSIPSDRLFLETDMSGEEIESVYRRAADIRNEPAESLRDAVHTNYLNLFGL